MSEDFIKWLVANCVGGGLGVWALLELRQFRKDMRNLPGWLAAIHSRLGTLGADTLPPPIPDEVETEVTGRHEQPTKLTRIQTSPVGFPITRRKDPR